VIIEQKDLFIILARSRRFSLEMKLPTAPINRDLRQVVGYQNERQKNPPGQGIVQGGRLKRVLEGL
jgi:hypothetical protein